MMMRWRIHICLSRMADDNRKNEVKMPLRLIEVAGGGMLLGIAGWILCGEPLFLLLLLSLNKDSYANKEILKSR